MVENDIPLLISNQTMSRMKLVMDLNKKTIQFRGKVDSYHMTKTGHIVVNIKSDIKKSDTGIPAYQFFQQCDIRNQESHVFHNNPFEEPIRNHWNNRSENVSFSSENNRRVQNYQNYHYHNHNERRKFDRLKNHWQYSYNGERYGFQ